MDKTKRPNTFSIVEEIETARLRKNLSDHIEHVKHGKVRLRVTKHNKPQVSVVADEYADLVFDLTLEQLKEIGDDISSYLEDHSEETGKVVNLYDVVRAKG